MSERPTLLTRGVAAPTVQPTQSGAPQGAFGDFRGVEAFGQGLQQAGQAGMSYAFAEQDRQRREEARLQKILKEQQTRDLAGKDKLAFETMHSGVLEKFKLAVNNKALPEDSVAFIDRLLSEGDKSYREYTADLRAHPLYKEAVSDDERKTQSISLRNSLLEQAISYDASRNLEGRVSTYSDRITIALKSVENPSDQVARTEALISEMEKDNLPRTERDRLRARAGDNLYARLHLQIEESKQPLDRSVFRQSSALSDEQKERLILAGEKFAPKLMNSDDQIRITEEVHAALAEGKPLTPEQQKGYEAALAAAKTASETPGKDQEGAASRLRTIENNQKAALAFGYLGTIAAEQGTHEQNTALTTALLSNDSTLQYLRQNHPGTNWDSLPSETITKYRTQAFKKVSAVVEAFNNHQATRILDTLPTVRGAADAVVVAMRRAGSAATPEEANLHAQTAIREYKGYKAALTEEYNRRGTPSDLRPMIPELIMSDLDNAYSQEQASSAVAQFHNARAVFGREGTDTIVRRFANSRNGSLRDKSHLAAFAATQHMALFGAMDGTINNALLTSDKEMFDTLVNLPEKRRQWNQVMEGHEALASKVVDSVYYQSDPDAEKVLSGAAIKSVRSRTQSLISMARGMAWTFDLPTLESGAREMQKALITQEALSGAREAGDRVGDFIAAGNAVLNRLSQSMAVVKTSLTDNPTVEFGVIPVSLAQQEKWYQTPIAGGASSAAQFGEKVSAVIEASSTALYSTIDRTGFGNIPDALNLLRDGFVRHTWLSWFSGVKLNDSIHPLPDTLRIPVGLTDIAPRYAGSGKNEVPLAHPSSWGAAGNRVAVEALSTLQGGAWRPNPVSGRMELFIRSAGQPVMGADEVPNRNYRPVKLEKTGETVGFSIASALDYDQQFRWKRAIGPLEYWLGGEPLTRENPDIINFAEAKLP